MTGTHGYQLYFTDQSFRLIGHQTFDADSDLQALRVAGAVFRACQDECEGAEVWRDGKRIFRFEGVDRDRPFWVTGRASDIVAELEETLANSHWAIARSRHLLASLTARAARPSSVVPRSER